MNEKTELKDIYTRLLEAEYDLECYVKVLDDLEDYYYYADNIEACRRFHIIKCTCRLIHKKMRKGINALDLYLMDNK